MVKKNVIVRSLLIAICAIILVGCPDGFKAPTPELVIDGTITDENGQPLEDILVCLDTAILAAYENACSWPHWYDYAKSTTEKGRYVMRYRHGQLLPLSDKWPSEVLVIAGDTTGVYEMQSKKFPVIERDANTVTYGYVTADFVMKKKK